MNEQEKALSASIAHWIRMRAWARKQKQTAFPLAVVMEKEIGENWGPDYCALCELHTDGLGRACNICALGVKFGPCGSHKPNDNAWPAVLYSTTWAEWDTHATELLEQLRSLEG